MSDEPTFETEHPRSDLGLLDDDGKPYAEAPPDEPTDVPEEQAAEHPEPEGSAELVDAEEPEEPE